MKDHVPTGKQWTLAMHPLDKEVLSSAMSEYKITTFRDVVLFAVNQLHPQTHLYNRTLGDLNNECPGIMGIVAMILNMRKEFTERGFVEFMTDLRYQLDKEYEEVRGD